MKPIAVVILNWNGASLLREYLPTVCRNTPASLADIIVADNGSTDNSVEVLQQDFPAVNTILFAENYGFAEGYNRAIEQLADYRYIVLLNSDVAVADGWLQPLYDYAELHDDVAAMQPKIRAYRDKESFEYAGAAGGYLDCNGFPYCRGRIFDTVERDNGQYDDVCEVAWASGAALFVRTDLYRKAGGLDAKFFAHMEEIDLCWRLRLMGYRIMAVPQGVVYHYGGASLDSASPRKLYLNYRNNLLMMYKNLPADIRAWRIFRRMLYDGVSALKYLVSGQFSYVKAVWDAHFDYRKMKGQYHTRPAENRLNDLPQGRVNIILDYFLLGKKRYTDVMK
ncbi:MAG: glycosyltransferase family 2 protein [Bacteroidaceae bacterium]|nr:glycosyltransferase family 2 protein [Bacteroidaceae bacterium]